ncbi:MAG: FadR/GntR family transcriptional regulator [Actinomadura sp.]
MDEFAPVRRTSVAVAVFDQIAAQILAGTLTAGTALPPERSLTESFAVNRQAVREALQRLDQLGLVEIRHGDATRIRDYRSSCGLDLLPRLFLRADGAVDAHVVRSVLEMRAAIGADAAALCATRADGPRIAELHGLLDGLAAALDGAEPSSLPALAAHFWDVIVDGSDNICYRLSLNALRRAYQPAEAMIDSLMVVEHGDLAGHREVVAAIAAHDADRARAAATTLLARGTDAITALFTDLENPR